MSYLGNEPQFTQYPSKFFNGDGTAMTVSLDYAPPNAAALLVFIDGVRQDTSAYTISGGTSLTFTGSVPSGTNNVQVVHMGLTVDVGTPGDATVTAAKLSTTGTPDGSKFLRDDMAWQDVPAGAPTGGGTEKIFFNNENSVDVNYTIPADTNSVSAGPITIQSGITVTVGATSNWVIV
jgi:hypothetical protein